MPAPRQIRSHIALRGIAALLVVAYHLQFGAIDRLAIETCSPFLMRGYLWVDLFFVLSGFIISYAYDGDRSTPFGWRQAGVFLRARIFRLYPLHLVCLLGLIAVEIALGLFQHYRHPGLAAFGDAHRWWTALVQVLLLNAWSKSFVAWNIPSWSISAELVAYALFPAIVSAHALRRRSAEGIMLAAAIGFFGFVASTSGTLDMVGGPFAIVRCLAGFLLGMIVFYHRRRCEHVPILLLAALQIACCSAILMLVAVPVGDAWLPPLFVLLVWSSWTDRGPLPWLVIRRPLLWLGRISYSIYLTHVPLLALLGAMWFPIERRVPLGAEAGRIVWIVLVTGTVLLVSHVTFRYVEGPARQRLTRRWTGHAARPIAAAPAAP